MNIELNDLSIRVCADQFELKSYHRNQLKYFGFIKDPSNENCYSFLGNPEIDKIIQLVTYFEKQGFDLELSETIEKIVQDEKSKSLNFSIIKEKAQQFKNGDLDQEGFRNFCEFASTFPRKFKKHQLKSAFHHCIVINSADFSVPGSGKTACLLLTYESFRVSNKVNRIFVVGPPSSFTAWKNEFFLTLGRKPKIKVLSGQEKEARIANYYNYFDDTELFLITFQSFANDYNHILKFFSHPTNKVFFVVDEAHYIKQLDGNWASAVLEVSRFATSNHVLTGTPCPHKYSDLFNLFDLIWGKNRAISEMDKNRVVGYEKNMDYLSAGTIIKKDIDPLFYRVRKSDLGLTPQQFHDPIFIKMNKIEREIYDSIYKRIGELSKFDSNKNINNLISLKRGRIIRLRQAISYAKLLSNGIIDYDEKLDDTDLGNLIINYDDFETPAKVEYILNLAEKIRKTEPKIVIWSNFIDTINYLEDIFSGAGVGCKHIYGSVPILEVPNSEIMSRENVIEEFLRMDSGVDVLIANPAACAESISLHKTCHNTIYYDLSYNCAQYLQSLDRIHRVGGSEISIASYYFLLYEDTIDLDILKNLNSKRDKMEQVIEVNSDIYNLDVDPFIDSEEDEEAYDRIFM